MALYGCARVSTSDQDFTLQEQALCAAGKAFLDMLGATEIAGRLGVSRTGPPWTAGVR